MFDFYITINGPDPGPQLKQIQERLAIMPTEAEFDTKLAELGSAITAAVETEITELAATLATQGVSQSVLDKVEAARVSLVNKVAGIVPTPPPAA